MINTIEQQIQELENTITGNLWDDAPTMAKIYELKKQLTPVESSDIVQEEEDECLYCGS
jgi:Mg2+ and Co2+ transporter CorA